MRFLIDELKALDTGARALRRFGLMVGAVLLLSGLAVAIAATEGAIPDRLGDLPGRMAGALPGVLLLAGLALTILGALRPGLLKGPYIAWMGLALALGFVMTRVILTVVFFGVVTPIALFRRMLGRDSMHRHPDPKAATYWIRRDPDKDVRASLDKYW